MRFLQFKLCYWYFFLFVIIHTTITGYKLPVAKNKHKINEDHIHPKVKRQNYNATCGRPYTNGRIIYPDPTSTEHWPWMIYLVIYDYVDAGSEVRLGAASLVSTRHAVTVAHVFYDPLSPGTQRDITLITGYASKINNYVYENDQEMLGVQRVNYFNYNYATGENDIAVITWHREVTFRLKINSICLPDLNDPIRNPPVGTVIGWGDTAGTGGPGDYTRLNRGVMRIRKLSLCERYYRDILNYNIRLDDRLVCAGGAKASAPCNGDSGGPLMVQHNGKWYLYGIIQSSTDCSSELPALFTNVEYYLDDINNVIRSGI